MGEQQRRLWLTAGLSAAVGACGCGIGWLWMLAGGIAACVYYYYMEYRAPAVGVAAQLKRPLAVISWFWTTVVLAWAANLADFAFPMLDGFPLLGWIMLALALWASRKSVACCAACAGVLCLFLLVLYGVVSAFALPDVTVAYLAVGGRWDDAVAALGLFLTPAVLWYLPCKKGKGKPGWKLWLLPTGAALLCAITSGVLSPRLAGSELAPLYILAQSVSLFGIMERIEPLLSVAMVMGVFCLLTALLCGCTVLGKKVNEKADPGIISSVLAGGFMRAGQIISPVVLAVGCLLIWVAIPIGVIENGRQER